jgi:hypothetical protein
MSDFSAEQAHYRFDFWFDNPEHDDCANFGPEYFTNVLYRSLITRLGDVPADGYVVVLGTNRCVSFEILCDFFGAARCLGYDLYNPSGHPRVITKDCSTLSAIDDIPIAFCHNDVGSYPTTPLLKEHCQRWAARNVVAGGYVLGRNNRSRAKFDVEAAMTELGFVSRVLSDLAGEYELSALTPDCLESHMLSRRSPCTSR